MHHLLVGDLCYPPVSVPIILWKVCSYLFKTVQTFSENCLSVSARKNSFMMKALPNPWCVENLLNLTERQKVSIHGWNGCVSGFVLKKAGLLYQSRKWFVWKTTCPIWFHFCCTGIWLNLKTDQSFKDITKNNSSSASFTEPQVVYLYIYILEIQFEF